MKSEFKAKFIQNLISKKKGNEGFTLIELLVVIIIVGVLAAIALPSFLNQIGKARGSEAKSNIGTINRAQQGYRLENNIFASTLTNLDAKISGKFYTYNLGTGTATGASVGATLTAVASDLKTYSGAVTQTAADFFGQVICESTTNNGAIPAPTAPTAAGAAAACTNGSVIQ
jgi:prepilin-type N-terminal cleavage/methylation domain-containing protein